MFNSCVGHPPDQYKSYFEETWPKALGKLKGKAGRSGEEGSRREALKRGVGQR